ncbi:unnamed protein product, partial [Choristocarpus tenellus]
TIYLELCNAYVTTQQKHGVGFVPFFTANIIGLLYCNFLPHFFCCCLELGLGLCISVWRVQIVNWCLLSTFLVSSVELSTCAGFEVLEFHVALYFLVCSISSISSLCLF